MRRRDFIKVFACSGTVWPLIARAQQQGGRMQKIGVLALGTPDNPNYQANVEAFVTGLRERGWVEGRNVSIAIRWGSGSAELEKAYADELIKMAPDALLAAGTANLTFLRQMTQSIPIVFLQVSDPVAQHFVASLTHPGGNLTGFAAYEFTIGGKWLEMLKQVTPALTRVAVMFNPDTSPQNEHLLRAMQGDAATSAVQVVAARIRSDADIASALEDFAREPDGGLILPTDNYGIGREALIAEMAMRHRLPAISGNGPSFARAGGLMYYGVVGRLTGEYGAAAGYVDRILKGEKPTDLPVQLPTKYELVINLKAAKSLGLSVPQSLLVAADEVIE